MSRLFIYKRRHRALQKLGFSDLAVQVTQIRRCLAGLTEGKRYMHMDVV
jgi:hypothetical protein